MDTTEFGEQIVALLQDEVGDHLRSVIGYTSETYTIHYIRKDVEDAYSEENLDQVLEELRLETLEKEYLNTIFQEMHGDFEYRLDMFGDAVEMNFVVADGEGLEVAIDRAYFAQEDRLANSVLQLVERYQGEESSSSG
ncbi:DUF7522 family protein [Halospeciosus flavus]|uniref:DUF7522 family protein n=1 Tax=Halospeciosus flavus TaxID=3032283 RepID=UPI00361F7E17